LFFSLSNPSMYVPFAVLLNDAAYKLHDYLKIVCLDKKRGDKVQKLERIECMPEAVTEHHELDWVVRVDISLLPEDAPACSVCCPACAT